MVAKGKIIAKPSEVVLRHPASFVPGELHRHYSKWEEIAPADQAKEVYPSLEMVSMYDRSSYLSRGHLVDVAMIPHVPRHKNSLTMNHATNSRILLILLFVKEYARDLYCSGTMWGKSSHPTW